MSQSPAHYPAKRCGLLTAILPVMLGDNVDRRGRRRTPRRDRFLAKIDTSPGRDACHPWRGSLNLQGYGFFQGSIDYHTYSFLAHRIAWALAHDSEPGALWVLHECDNPPCCNPLHLYRGTPHDNHRDAVDRRRLDHPDDPFQARGPLGVTAHAANFSDGRRALAIALRYAQRQPMAVIAAELGCHRSTLSRWFRTYEAALIAGPGFGLQPWRAHGRPGSTV